MAAAYPWTEQDGAWRRKLGSMESFYMTLATPEGAPVHWMVGCGMSIVSHGSDDLDIETAVREASKVLRDELPSIAAVVDPATVELIVGSKNLNTVDYWLNNSFRVHEGIHANELFSAFTSEYSMTLHFLRDTNELVIQAMHSLIDGRGMLYLYHALFNALSKSKTLGSNGLETSRNLSRPLDEWLNLLATLPEANVKDAQSIFQRFVQATPIRLPGVDFTRQPRKDVQRQLRLGEECTQDIIVACKRKGITVTTAWHTALAIAVQKIQSETGEDGSSYTQFTAIDLRRWFNPPFSPYQHSIASLQTTLPFVVDLGKDSDFDIISESLQKDCKRPFAFANDDFSCLGPGMTMYHQILKSGGAPPSSTPYLSSMGVINDVLAARYGDWELSNYWIGSKILTGNLQIYLWTWRGQMVFSACYNDAFYETQEIDSVLQRMRDEMMKGLGLI